MAIYVQSNFLEKFGDLQVQRTETEGRPKLAAETIGPTSTKRIRSVHLRTDPDTGEVHGYMWVEHYVGARYVPEKFPVLGGDGSDWLSNAQAVFDLI